MNYTLKISVKGRPMYYKENKLVSKNDIPQVVLNNILPGEPYDYVLEGPQEIVKECLFCGAFSNLTRMVNGKVIVLCDSHFYSESLGKIVQKVRELENVQESRQDREEVPRQQVSAQEA